MACCFLEIFVAAVLLAVAPFPIVGAILRRQNRLQGALIGLVVGVFIGPMVVNLLFFDPPKAGPVPEIVVGQ
ncbi:MAG: hypothetical protein GY948_23810 [Alphaproteobacteria bacterium]|nr:hypothetical protein [Alphaproteobacteria bacterium]